MKSLIDTNQLKLLQQSPDIPGRYSPPHALIETSDCFSIFLNLFGVDRKDIAVGIDEKKRELTVLAKRERERVRSAFFWMFSLPEEGEISEIRMRYKNGAVEIRIPKVA